MRLPLLLVLPLSIILASVNTTVYATPSQTIINEKVEIEQVFKSYMAKYNHFIINDELKLSPVLYDENVMLITGAKPAILTPESMNAGVTGFLSQLKKKGVTNVAWDKVDIKLLSNNIALASNVAVRYLANGEVYDRAGATYFLNKAPDGWKITAFALHAPENAFSFLPEN